MTTSIFIRSWRRDRFWLDYCLRSLERFAHGFVETVVVIPENDKAHFEATDFHGAKVCWVSEKEGTGPLSQQRDKLHADEYCAGDLILFLDSDCFMLKETRPEDFMANGRPIALIRHWADASTAAPWKPITEAFLKFTPSFETMCNLPIIFDRRELPLLRDYCKSIHGGMSIDEYVLSRPRNEFSEFNAVLNFAIRYCPFMHHWQLAAGNDGFPRDRIVQRWTWGNYGVEKFADGYERILAQ